MVKVVGIVENDSITGVKYGTIEVPETPIEIRRAHEQFKKVRSARTAKVRGERTKKK